MNRRTISVRIQQTSMDSHLLSPSVVTPTRKDTEVYNFVKMIIQKNLPLSVVEDEN